VLAVVAVEVVLDAEVLDGVGVAVAEDDDDEGLKDGGAEDGGQDVVDVEARHPGVDEQGVGALKVELGEDAVGAGEVRSLVLSAVGIQGLLDLHHVNELVIEDHHLVHGVSTYRQGEGGCGGEAVPSSLGIVWGREVVNSGLRGLAMGGGESM
jgi:hypothetical protein